VRSGRLVCTAGTSDVRIPLANATTPVKASAGTLITPPDHAPSPTSHVRTSCAPPNAIASAPTAPNTASNTPSMTSCTIRRLRLTPSARRTAISRRRPRARTSSRFATFAHAINRTISATPPNSFPTRTSLADPETEYAHSDFPGMIDPRVTVCESSRASRSAVGFVIRERAQFLYTALASDSARCTSTPGLSRASTSSHCEFVLVDQSAAFANRSPLAAVIGSHRSTSRISVPVNPRGVTPTIV